MAGTCPYGRWRLELLEELSMQAWRRLAAELSAAAEDATVKAILAQTVRRRRATLRAMFGCGPLRPRAGREALGLWGQLISLERSWMTHLAGLADDNELDVPRPGRDGRRRMTSELAAGWILDSAQVAGQVAQAVRPVRPVGV